MKIYGLVLAGGSGKRLFPLSDKGRPKQLMKLNGESLVKRTVDRLSFLDEVYISTNQVIYDEIKKEFNHEYVVINPISKETALSVLFSCLKLKRGIMVVTPSDHDIGQFERFKDSIDKSVMKVMNDKKIVMIGVKPKTVEKSFGYIKNGSFVEKPTEKIAELLIEKGYLWNTGIFIFDIEMMLEEYQRYLPDMFFKLRKGLLMGDLSKRYEECEKVSVYKGLLSKSNRIEVIEGEFDWNDVGNFDRWGKALGEDEKQNVLVGDVDVKDSENCVLYSTDKKILGIGLNNLVVIEVDNVIVVVNRDESERVKELIKRG